MIRKPIPITSLLRQAVAGLLLVGVVTSCPALFGQSWPVNSPEVYAPVPQYSPRYPLTSESLSPLEPTTESQLPVPAVSPDPVPQPTRNHNFNPGTRIVEPGPVQDHRDAYAEPNTMPIAPHPSSQPGPHPAASKSPCTGGCTSKHLPGINGRPYQEKAVGGCTCGKKHPSKHPQFSVYWPRPFSAKLDERFPAQAAQRYQPCQKKRIVDVFDSLSTFKLIDYQRTDNGYCGRGSDPYGCLGESRQSGLVRGVGYRLPAQPVTR